MIARLMADVPRRSLLLLAAMYVPFLFVLREGSLAQREVGRRLLEQLV